ncbi:uncharacterized protein G2W53_027534 [Senna tora]|uniref:Uncharacterized protein n=1 Tax=Senna tora TaxID=362788 RepID=A0A834WMB3_9FABA|nr:uncharacterized protein G2W53_027534 [Senna tora]
MRGEEVLAPAPSPSYPILAPTLSPSFPFASSPSLSRTCMGREHKVDVCPSSPSRSRSHRFIHPMSHGSKAVSNRGISRLVFMLLGFMIGLIVTILSFMIVLYIMGKYKDKQSFINSNDLESRSPPSPIYITPLPPSPAVQPPQSPSDLLSPQYEWMLPLSSNSSPTTSHLLDIC